MERQNRRPSPLPPKKSQPGQGGRGRGGRKALRAFFLTLITLILIGATTAAICGMALAVYINKYISPSADVDLTEVSLNETSFIYYLDQSGQEVQLQKLHGGEDRVWTPIEEIPKKLQLAFVSVEDSRFYTHQGVDWKRTIGATLNFLVGVEGFAGGGSTITQQLIKNVTDDDETSVVRKITEIMRALELERNVEKDDILELYLNIIFFGQNAYGVRQAAKTFFGKELSQLTLGECAALAGIVKNPYKYNPLRRPEDNEERRQTVLYTMRETGNITSAEYEAAMAEKITVQRQTESDEELLEEYQSYYIDAVIDAVLADLQEKYGRSELWASQLLFNGGLKIVVPIDLGLQAKMDAVFQDVDNFPGGLGSSGTYPQAAMAIIDAETGYVRALYGGRGPKYGNRIFNRATQAHRQPGSAIKPLTVYTPAFEYLDGFLPITVLDDAPKDFTVSETGWPKNENRRYSGRTTIYRGIGSSLNTIAVDIMQKLTPNRAYTYAKNAFNFSDESLVESQTITRKKDGPVRLTDIAVSPLALGGLTNGVTVMEMTAAYATFVNGGYYNEPILYTEVRNSKDEVILSREPQLDSDPVMTARTRDYMLDLLTYVTKAGTATKARIEGLEVGGKTGTTSDDNDRWFAGITPEYAGVVWFGYDMPESLQKFKTNPALELWHRVMSDVYAGMEPGTFKTQITRSNAPDAFTTVQYCQDSGMLAGHACAIDYRGASRVATATLLKADAERLIAQGECNLHVAMNIDLNTGGLATPFCPQHDAEGRPLQGERGILVLGGDLSRLYPHPGVAITDHEWVYDGDPADGAGLTPGLYRPATVSRIHVCSVHNAENNGSIIEGPDDYLPVDPEEGNGGEEGPAPTEPTHPNPLYPTEPPATEPVEPNPTDPTAEEGDAPVHYD